jgi:uncharacterized cupredoxin-like copper-binding protein
MKHTWILKVAMAASLGLSLAAGANASGDMDASASHDHTAPEHTTPQQRAADSDATAVGAPAAKGAKVTRTVEITMSDAMRFSPDRIAVKKGETVRFFIKNEGKMTHEFILGDSKEIQEHAAMMQKMQGVGAMAGMHHADGNMLSLQAGQRSAVVWTFSKAGTLPFACTVPGHMPAGMAGKIVVD